MASEKLTGLILVISTLDREHNFLGLFDKVQKKWILEKEFKAAIAEEFFPIFKKLISKQISQILTTVVVEQVRGSFSGLRLEAAIANSLKIKNPKLQLFGVQAKDIVDLKNKVVLNQDLKSAKNFIYPEYPGPASIH